MLLSTLFRTKDRKSLYSEVNHTCAGVNGGFPSPHVGQARGKKFRLLVFTFVSILYTVCSVSLLTWKRLLARIPHDKGFGVVPFAQLCYRRNPVSSSVMQHGGRLVYYLNCIDHTATSAKGAYVIQSAVFKC